jgi:hypothetical protein
LSFEDLAEGPRLLVHQMDLLDELRELPSERGGKDRAELPKNSAANALLIELYRSAMARFGVDELLCLVTVNYEDFSAWKGDRRHPGGTRTSACPAHGPTGSRQNLACLRQDDIARRADLDGYGQRSRRTKARDVTIIAAPAPRSTIGETSTRLTSHGDAVDLTSRRPNDELGHSVSRLSGARVA